ncbi:MAG: hypothetical protein IKY74_03265 [Alistipes sp.]|nr:hypothetical protein [Alistipes sp.]
MAKLLYRYLLYFGVFIVIVQMLEYSGTQELFAKCCFKFNSEVLGTYAPLFLSVLLIDVTYRIGKRQNEIAKQQVSIQQQQYQLEKFNNYKDLHRNIYRCKNMVDIIPLKVHCNLIQRDNELTKSVDEYVSILDNLNIEIQDGVSDLMLKGEKDVDIKNVLHLISVSKDLLNYINTNHTRHYSTNDLLTSIIKEVAFEELKTIDEQLTYIKNNLHNKQLIDRLNSFSDSYNLVFCGENDILSKVQKLYKDGLQ